MEMYYFTVLEARNLRKRCWRNCSLLRSPLGSHMTIFFLFSYELPFVHIYVLISSSFKDISHVELGILPNDLSLTSLFLKDSISKYCDILRYAFWGNTTLPIILHMITIKLEYFLGLRSSHFSSDFKIN